MNFDFFIENLPNIINSSLIGEKAHQIMSPPERLDMINKINPDDYNPKVAAVMIAIYPKKNQTYFVLIERANYKGVHSAQISFPGGKCEESDLDFCDTALRETYEEIGISKDKLKVFKTLSAIYIPPSNFLVHPYVAISKEELKFKLDEFEVQNIIEVSIKDILDESKVVLNEMETSYSASIQVPAFEIDGKLVWGATAMILSEFKEILKMSILP